MTKWQWLMVLSGMPFAIGIIWLGQQVELNVLFPIILMCLGAAYGGVFHVRHIEQRRERKLRSSGSG
jgi:hypothetical protein